MPQCPHCGNEQEHTGRCKRCGGRVDAIAPPTHVAEAAIKLKGEGEVLSCPQCGTRVSGPRCRRCGKHVEAVRSDAIPRRTETIPRPAAEVSIIAPKARINPWLMVVAFVLLLGVAAEAVFLFSPDTAQGFMASFGMAPRVVEEGDGSRWTSLGDNGCFLYGMSEDEWDTVVPVPCSEFHHGQAFARLELSALRGDTTDHALAACLDTEPPGDAEVSVFVAPDDAWAAGDTRALCYFDFPDGRKG